MTDDELRSMLRTWEAPAAPEMLRERVFGRRRSPWWWLLTGRIHVPVPVALALVCLVVFVAYRSTRPPTGTLSDFQQVREFQPRIVRTVHEAR